MNENRPAGRFFVLVNLDVGELDRFSSSILGMGVFLVLPLPLPVYWNHRYGGKLRSNLWGSAG